MQSGKVRQVRSLAQVIGYLCQHLLIQGVAEMPDGAFIHSETEKTGLVDGAIKVRDAVSHWAIIRKWQKRSDDPGSDHELEVGSRCVS